MLMAIDIPPGSRRVIGKVFCSLRICIAVKEEPHKRPSDDRALSFFVVFHANF